MMGVTCMPCDVCYMCVCDMMGPCPSPCWLRKCGGTKPSLWGLHRPGATEALIVVSRLHSPNRTSSSKGKRIGVTCSGPPVAPAWRVERQSGRTNWGHRLSRWPLPPRPVRLGTAPKNLIGLSQQLLLAPENLLLENGNLWT